MTRRRGLVATLAQIQREAAARRRHGSGRRRQAGARPSKPGCATPAQVPRTSANAKASTPSLAPPKSRP